MFPELYLFTIDIFIYMKKIIITEQQLGNLMNKLRKKPQGPQGDTYESVKNRWSAVNTDTNSNQSFGEGISRDMNIAMEKARFNASANYIKKLNLGQTNLKTNVIDEKIFEIESLYHCLVLVEINQV